MSPSGLANQLSDLFTNNEAKGNVFSLTLATVVNISDEQNLNRVQCLPLGSNDNELTDWCYVMTPMAGKERGLFLFPQVDDLVVLGYLENDVHRPIVLGSFWTTDSMPPFTVQDGKAEDYCLKTPQKVALTLHDEDQKQKLTITMPSGIVIEIDDEQQTVTTKNQGGDTALTMKMKDGEIELAAKKKLTLSAGKTTITLEDSGDITLKGNGDVSLDGKGINVKAQGSVSLKGMDIAVQATKDLALKSSGTAALKGSLLKLN